MTPMIFSDKMYQTEDKNTRVWEGSLQFKVMNNPTHTSQNRLELLKVLGWLRGYMFLNYLLSIVTETLFCSQLFPGLVIDTGTSPLPLTYVVG